MSVWRDLKQIRPRSFSQGRPGGPPRIIFIHYTAGKEGPTAAEDGARYDRRRTDGTSAHYYVDSNSVVQCVDTADRSHTALYNANLVGIHYELCGTRQSRADWLDSTSRATIRRAARQIARDMRKYDIPLKRLVGRQVRAGRGIAGHVDATRGWPEDGGTHTDPGTQFPWGVLFDDIEKELGGVPDEGGGDLKKYPDFKTWYAPWGGHVQSLIHWFTQIRPRELAEEKAEEKSASVLRRDLDAVTKRVQTLETKVADLTIRVDALTPHAMDGPGRDS
jgi:hypothetical protein